MRLVLGFAVLVSMAASPALACDFHEGGGYDSYTGYEPVLSDAELAAREARVAADRDQAMVEARNNFLARFDIKAEGTLMVATVEARPFPQSTDADRSARADSQDR